MASPLSVMLMVPSLCYGGAEKHVITLANKLNSDWVRCSLVYLKPNEAMLDQVDRSRLDAVISLKVRGRIDPRAVRALSEHIDRLAIDVVVCATEYPTLWAWLATRSTRRKPKLVEIFHTTVFGSRKERLLMWLYRWIFRRLDLLIYVSLRQQQYWQCRGLAARDSAMIHNGIDCDHFQDLYPPSVKSTLRAQYGFAPHDFVVGLCAALRPEKAHSDLLRAIAQLRGEGLKVRCLIIGDGVERARIEGEIARLQLASYAAITGFQSDVRPFLASCDAIALPSHSVETFSIAALEAMAMGKPTVLSRIGGAEEIVVDGETGFLFEAGAIDQLADRLRRLADVPTRQRMGTAGSARVRALFTESAMMQRYAELLSKLAASPDQ